MDGAQRCRRKEARIWRGQISGLPRPKKPFDRKVNFRSYWGKKVESSTTFYTETNQRTEPALELFALLNLPFWTFNFYLFSVPHSLHL